MSSNKKPKREMLERIPYDELTQEQKEHWDHWDHGDNGIGFYKLTREPEYLSDFELYGPRMTISHDNGTFTYISHHCKNRYSYRSLELQCGGRSNGHSLWRDIAGKSDTAIAETAALFWSLKDVDGSNGSLMVLAKEQHFDFSAVTPDQFAHL